jgi:hypothetical protein
VLSVIDGDAPIAELLSRLAPPPPAPWRDGVATEGDERRLAVQELAAVRRTVHGDVGGVVRALLSEGSAGVADPTLGDLPAWIASIERVLPVAEAARHGVWTALEAREPAVPDRVAELAAAAWREPSSRAAQAWTLLCELAIARGESIDRVGAALEAIDAGAVLTTGERAEVAGAASVVDVLHAWGRGRLDASPAAASLPARLADLVALRVLVRLAADRDAGHAIAEARWYALLSSARRRALLAAVAARTRSLRGFVEGKDCHA